MPHPYIEQGIAATEMLLTYGNSNCISGKLLHVAIEKFQLEIGSEFLFLQLDHKKWVPILQNVGYGVYGSLFLYIKSQSTRH